MDTEKIMRHMESELCGEYNLNSVSLDGLPAIVRASERAKDTFFEILGGKERYEIELGKDTDLLLEAFPSSVRALERLAPDGVTVHDIISGRMPDGRKTSRVILNHAGRESEIDAYFPRRELKGVQRDTPYIQLSELVRAFYDNISSYQAKAIVSCNAWDIISASEFSAFTSCYSFAGCYSASVISRTIDSHSLIVKLLHHTSDQTIGRFWITVSDCLKKFTISPTYGTLSDGIVKTIRHEFQTLLARYQNIEDEWKYSTSVERHMGTEYYDNVRGIPYVDKPHIMVRHASLDAHDYSFGPAYKRPICVSCGNRHIGRALLCDDCQKETVTCCHCGAGVSADDVIYHDDRCYCSDCFNDLFSRCERCDGYIANDDAYFLDDTCYCDSCYGDVAVTCEHCEETYHFDGGYVQYCEGVGMFLCDHCRENHYFTCPNCDAVHEQEDAIFTDELTGDEVCSECVESNRQTIVRIMHNTALEDIGSFWYVSPDMIVPFPCKYQERDVVELPNSFELLSRLGIDYDNLPWFIRHNGLSACYIVSNTYNRQGNWIVRVLDKQGYEWALPESIFTSCARFA